MMKEIYEQNKHRLVIVQAGEGHPFRVRWQEQGIHNDGGEDWVNCTSVPVEVYHKFLVHFALHKNEMLDKLKKYMSAAA